MPQSGYSPEICLDFDFSVIDWWDWFEGKTNETKPGPAGKPLEKGMTLVPKYTDLEDIFVQYRPPNPELTDVTAILDEEEMEGLLIYLDETTEPAF